MFIPLNYILIIEKQNVGLLLLWQISDKKKNTNFVDDHPMNIPTIVGLRAL
jgi:hypothetical protein